MRRAHESRICFGGRETLVAFAGLVLLTLTRVQGQGLTVTPSINALGGGGGGSSDRASIDFLLLMDESGSMEVAPPQSDQQRLRVDAARLFVELCAPQDRVGVVGFGQRITNHTGTELRAVDPQWRKYLHRQISAVGGNQLHTDILGALKKGQEMLENRQITPNRTFMILLTDGQVSEEKDIPPEYLERYSIKEYRDEIFKMARDLGRRGLPVLSIGLGPAVDESLLRDIASLSRGQFYRARTAGELQAIYSDIFVSLADRFSRRTARATSPLEVVIEPGLKEFIALAFPEKAIPRSQRGSDRYFRAGFKFIDPSGKEISTDQNAATRSWNLVRLKSPMPGKWKIVFDPGQSVDILLVKHTGCSIRVLSPAENGEYPAGPVPVRVEVMDPAGNPSAVCAGSIKGVIEGASPMTTFAMTPSGPGLFKGVTPPLLEVGPHRLTLKVFPQGGDDFSNVREVLFYVKPAAKIQSHPLKVTVVRPDAAQYPKDVRVPVKIQIKAADDTPISSGDIDLKLSVTNPRGDPVTVVLTEQSPGVFSGQTPNLNVEGGYTLDARATLKSDSQSAGKDQFTFQIIQPPPVPLAITFVEPAQPRYYPGALPVKVQVKRGDGSPIPAGEARVTMDISGGGLIPRQNLVGASAGVFEVNTPVLHEPGPYEIIVRCQLRSDPRSLAEASKQIEIVPPGLEIQNLSLSAYAEGEAVPLFLGEGFTIRFNLNATGTLGQPEIRARLSGPGSDGQPIDHADLPIQTLASGAFQIDVESTDGLGMYRVDIKATAPTGGPKPLQAVASLPIPVLLTAMPESVSLPGDQISTYTLPLLSMFEYPVNVVARVLSIEAVDGGDQAPPKLTVPEGGIQLTQAETTDEFDPLLIGVDPEESAYVPFESSIELLMAGRYDDGTAWQRSKVVSLLEIKIESPPLNPTFWIFLLLVLAAVMWAKPNFRSCYVKVGEDRPIPLAHYAGLTDNRISVGGPGQRVVITDSDVTPVIIEAGWGGKYNRRSDGISYRLKSGDSFTLGATAVMFFRGAEPRAKPPADPDDSGETDTHSEDVTGADLDEIV